MNPVVRAQALRFPGLDGLRALAVSLVLVDHAFWLPNDGAGGHATGYLGVCVFFVISGFLITSLLAREMSSAGKLDLRNFYARRVLRIFPAFYFYIAVLIALRMAGLVSFPWRGVWAPATFTRNIFYSAPMLNHFWSLSVEEQFYLLWPAALVLLGVRRACRAVTGVLLLLPVIFAALWHLGLHQVAAWTDPFVSLAAGCALALQRERLHRWRLYGAALRSRWASAVALPVVALLWWARGPSSAGANINRVEMLGVALGLAFAIDAAANGSFGFRWLDLPPLVWLGGLSYSLYVWQELFARGFGLIRFSLPLNLAAIFACACVSYYGVERPFLRWKRHFAPRPAASPARLARSAAAGNS